MKRTYEIMFILKPDLPEEEGERIIAQMENAITASGGALQKTNRMGKRKLAYRIGRYHEGQYVLLEAECEPAAVQEVERRLKVSEPVLRHQTVRVDEELKRAAKVQQQRAKRSARRKPKPAAEASAAPA